MNFQGPAIERVIKKLGESSLKEGMYWKAECLNPNDVEECLMSVRFTILSGYAERPNKGKLAFTVRLDKIWQFYKEICEAQNPPLDPLSMV